MLVLKISINFSWKSDHFDVLFVYAGVQNKKVANFVNEAIGGSVRYEYFLDLYNLKVSKTLCIVNSLLEFFPT